MTQTTYKSRRTLLASLLAMLLAVLFVVSATTASHAADPAPLTEVLEVHQEIIGSSKPDTITGTYGLIPARAENPMPVPENGDQKPINRFELTGDNKTVSASFTFTAPGQYEYTLGKLKDPTKQTFTKDDFEEGTKTQPLTHTFGFQVMQKDDGTLYAKPYTCEDPTIDILSNGDLAYGVRVNNYIRVDEPTTTTTTTTTKAPTKPAPKPTSAPTSKVTSKKAGKVNTGDKSHPVLWISVMAVAGIGLLILILARRNREDKEDG